MAKDKLTDYDATASNNTDVGGISVAEGMLPSGVNNAIREQMSHQKEAFGLGTPLYVDQTNNRLGIGTASPTKKVSASIGLNDTDGYVLEYSGDAKGGILLNPISGEVRMGALNSSGTYFTTLYSNNAERLRILSTGGITFNGDTAQANALDDYEEGALSLSSSTGTASFNFPRYTKVGNQVTVRFYVDGFSDLSTASAISITGLPYASSSSNVAVQGIIGRYANTISGDAYVAYVGQSSSTLIFFKTANNANYAQIQHAHLTSAAAQFFVTLTYEAA